MSKTRARWPDCDPDLLSIYCNEAFWLWASGAGAAVKKALDDLMDRGFSKTDAYRILGPVVHAVDRQRREMERKP